MKARLLWVDTDCIVNSALHRVDDVVLDVTDREVFGLETCNSLLGVFLLVAQA